jgi:hypothetical protein
MAVSFQLQRERGGESRKAKNKKVRLRAGLFNATNVSVRPGGAGRQSVPTNYAKTHSAPSASFVV